MNAVQGLAPTGLHERAVVHAVTDGSAACGTAGVRPFPSGVPFDPTGELACPACSAATRMGAAATVYEALARSQRNATSINDVTRLALQLAGGEPDEAHRLLQSAVDTWTAVRESAAATYVDRNGAVIERPSRPTSAA